MNNKMSGSIFVYSIRLGRQRKDVLEFFFNTKCRVTYQVNMSDDKVNNSLYTYMYSND